MAFWKIYNYTQGKFDYKDKQPLTIVDGERNIYNYFKSLGADSSYLYKNFGYTNWTVSINNTRKQFVAFQYKPTEKELEILRPKKQYTKLKPNKIGIKIGDVYYTEWGYDQTNIDLIIVTKISPTGKTIRAKRSSRENVGYSGQNNIIKPTFKPYGDEFQMKVVENDNRTYTLTGTYADSRGVAGFRKDYFRKYNGEKLYETDSQYGH